MTDPTISVAQLAVCCAIVLGLVRARQLRPGRRTPDPAPAAERPDVAPSGASVVQEPAEVEPGDLELAEQPFEVQDAVESALHLVAWSAADRGLELVAEVQDSCPTLVVGDPARFRQVLATVLGHAVQSTEQGEVVVTVAGLRLSEEQDGPVRLTVSVRDTGIGIPAGRLEQVFAPAPQGDGTGLASSRRLARAMGGDLVVTSREGVGSTFFFRCTVTSRPDRRGPSTLSSSSSLVGRRVLVVEDNRESRRVLELQLARWGVAATLVPTPAAAMELLAAGAAYDVAVLDGHLPELDGVQLATAIRALPGTLPLVLLTTPQQDLTPAERALFVATLTKPARSALLRATLLEAVGSVDVLLHDVSTAGGSRLLDGRAPEDTRLRVLLAEDDVSDQEAAQLVLGQLGHHVDTVSDGLQALEAVRRADYDVVLMDVAMPRMDGLEATARIRSEIPAQRQPMILAMTANVQHEDRAACLEAGVDAFLRTPVRSRELAAGLSAVRPRGAEIAYQASAPAGLPARVTSAPEQVEDRRAGLLQRARELFGELTPDSRTTAVLLFTAGRDRLSPLAAELLVAGRSVDDLIAGAHSLQGAASNLGARALAALCRRLEEHLHRGEVGDVPGVVAQVQTETTLTTAAMDALVLELSGPTAG